RGGMGGVGDSANSADIADRARLDGTYLMTASASTVAALAPPGERFTAFTGEIVDLCDRGIPDGPELLNMEKLYWHVRAELEAKRRPTPQQRADTTGGKIALVRNRCCGRGSAAPVAPPPRLRVEIPAELEPLTRRPPRDIARHVDELRAAGRGA